VHGLGASVAARPVVSPVAPRIRHL
jgi:hypothetical protein